MAADCVRARDMSISSVCVCVLLLRSVMPCDADARSECMNEMDGLTGRRQNQVEHVNLIDRKKQRIPDENYDLYM